MEIQFQIFKNTKKQENTKQPDFRMTSKIGDSYEDVGACWWKQDSKGNYYQSCVLKLPQVDLTKEEIDLAEAHKEQEKKELAPPF